MKDKIKNYKVFIIFPVIIYLVLSQVFYINRIKNIEFPKFFSAIEANINTIGEHYMNIDYEIRNDGVIKNWLENPNHQEADIIDYLKLIADRYGLEHASVIDDNSLIYYGTDKILQMSKENIHRDGWYFDYKKESSTLKGNTTLYVDKNFAKELTIFINIPIVNNSGKYLGVTGGGFLYKNFDSYLNQLERLYNVKFYLLKDSKYIYFNTGKIDNNFISSIEKYKNYPDGILLDREKMGGIFFLKYLPKWDCYGIIGRSNQQIYKDLLSSISYNLLFIIIAMIIAVIIFSQRSIIHRQKTKDLKLNKDIIFIIKNLNTIINTKITYYLKKENCENETYNLLSFQEKTIKTLYSMVEYDKKELKSCNIYNIIKNVLLFEIPSLLKSDIKIDLRILNKEIFADIVEDEFKTLLKLLIILLFYEVGYNKILVYQETNSNNIKINLIISNPANVEIIYKTEKVFKKLFGKINISYIKILNSTDYKKTEIIQFVFKK